MSLFDLVFRPGKWNEEHQRKIEAQERAKREAQERHEHAANVLRDWISGGRQLTMICGKSDVGLHMAEKLISVLPGSMLYEPRSVRVYQGGSSGTSIRVAKGMSFRVGGSRGHAESHDEIRLIDQGDFIITSQRVIFCGSTRTVTIDFDQIVCTTPFADGVRISKERRDKPYLFGVDTALTTTIDDATFSADGNFVSAMLDQAKVLSRCPKDMAPAAFMQTSVHTEFR
jgi:hypothetical protein